MLSERIQVQRSYTIWSNLHKMSRKLGWIETAVAYGERKYEIKEGFQFLFHVLVILAQLCECCIVKTIELSALKWSVIWYVNYSLMLFLNLTLHLFIYSGGGEVCLPYHVCISENN